MGASGGVVVAARTPRNTPPAATRGSCGRGSPARPSRASSASTGSATKPVADPRAARRASSVAAAAPVVEVGAGAEVAAGEPHPAAQPPRQLHRGRHGGGGRGHGHSSCRGFGGLRTGWEGGGPARPLPAPNGRARRPCPPPPDRVNAERRAAAIGPGRRRAPGRPRRAASTLRRSRGLCVVHSGSARRARGCEVGGRRGGRARAAGWVPGWRLRVAPCSPPPGRRHRPRRTRPPRSATPRYRRWVLLFGLLATVAAVVFPFAPVVQPQVDYRWSAADGAAALPLMPYQPVALTATVDCAAVRDGALLLVHRPAAPRPDRRTARGPAPHRRRRRRRSHQQRRRPRPGAARPRPVHGHRHLRPARHHRERGRAGRPHQGRRRPPRRRRRLLRPRRRRHARPHRRHPLPDEHHPTQGGHRGGRRARAARPARGAPPLRRRPAQGSPARLATPPESTWPSPRCSACGG